MKSPHSLHALSSESMGFLAEFKSFAMKGNIIDLAIGIMIGAAFNPIITSFINDILMPPIGILLGKVDFANLFFTLSGGTYATVADAKAAGAVTINYGIFLNTIFNFLLVAFVAFLLVKQIQKWKNQPQAATPTTKPCPLCLSTVPLLATKCSFCTSELT